jgi:hypothetical protein
VSPPPPPPRQDGFAIFVAREVELCREQEKERAHLSKIDPRLIATKKCGVFNGFVLRQALVMSQPFLPTADARRNEGIVSIFDDAGVGMLLASTGTEHFRFECDGFTGKSMHIPAQSVGDLARLLGSYGHVEMRSGSARTFAIALWQNGTGGLMSWANIAPAHDIAFPRLQPRVILFVQTKLVLRAVQHVAKVEASIRMVYDAASKMLRFAVRDGATAASVKVSVDPKSPEDGDYECDVSARSMVNLLKGTMGDVDLHLSRIADSAAGVGVLCTVDDYWLNFQGKLDSGPGLDPRRGEFFHCKVTRSAVLTGSSNGGAGAP